MLGVAGERFEYEMGALCAASRAGLPMVAVSIETVYEDGNSGSHFSPLRDSIRIYRVMFGDLLRYAGVSFSSFVLDQGLAWAFASALAAVGVPSPRAVWASGFAARLASSSYNYAMNRAFVFKDRGRVVRSAWRYAALCVAVICASNAAVVLLVGLGMPRGISKLLVDTVLYFVCYAVQRLWVFAAGRVGGNLV